MFRMDFGREPYPKMEYDGEIDWARNPIAAERKHRHIIDALYSVDTQNEIDAILEAEDVVLDAMYLSFPEYFEAVKDAAEEVKILLTSSNPTQAEPANIAQGNIPMFKIDTGVGGESGPFLRYKNRAGSGMADGTWYLTEIDGDNKTFTDMTDTMKNGIVLDIFATHDGQLGGTLKIGFINFETPDGKPNRAWWASPLAAEQRPDESKTGMGSYAWQNAVSVRCAIGGGRAATFDVTGWSGFKGVSELIQALNAGFAGNIGKCPVVQYTGFRTEGQGTKRLHVPEWTVAQWVDRPACLTPDAPQIAPAPAEQPAPAPQQTQQAPAPQAAPAASVPTGAQF